MSRWPRLSFCVLTLLSGLASGSWNIPRRLVASRRPVKPLTSKPRNSKDTANSELSPAINRVALVSIIDVLSMNGGVSGQGADLHGAALTQDFITVTLPTKQQHRMAVIEQAAESSHRGA